MSCFSFNTSACTTPNTDDVCTAMCVCAHICRLGTERAREYWALRPASPELLARTIPSFLSCKPATGKRAPSSPWQQQHRLWALRPVERRWAKPLARKTRMCHQQNCLWALRAVARRRLTNLPKNLSFLSCKQPTGKRAPTSLWHRPHHRLNCEFKDSSIYEHNKLNFRHSQALPMVNVTSPTITHCSVLQLTPRLCGMRQRSWLLMIRSCSPAPRLFEPSRRTREWCGKRIKCRRRKRCLQDMVYSIPDYLLTLLLPNSCFHIVPSRDFFCKDKSLDDTAALCVVGDAGCLQDPRQQQQQQLSGLYYRNEQTKEELTYEENQARLKAIYERQKVVAELNHIRS